MHSVERGVRMTNRVRYYMDNLKGVMGRLSTYITDPSELAEREVRVHWHFHAKKYSVSVRANNGRWYAVRNRATGEQVLFGKLVLMNARFRVQPAAARKAYETGKRTVHATVEGTFKRGILERGRATVPCGRMVMYSHNLYPQPEFKVQDMKPCGIPMAQWEPIREAEMVAMGCDPERLKPNMLVAGEIR